LPDTETPHVSFTIGGKELRISPSSLVGKEDGSDCLANLVGSDRLGAKPWILGAKWMSNFYTIFDSDNSRVGFADLISSESGGYVLVLPVIR
jgi:hypothetical protein